MATPKHGWEQFLHWCKQAPDGKTLGDLFDLILTPEEKNDITTRCLIVRELLSHEHSQRDIAKNLHVSIAKITRGSNELKRIKPQLIDFIVNNKLD